MSWRTAAYRAVRPLLFAIDSETVHRGTLAALRLASDGGAPGRGVCRLASGVGSPDRAGPPVELLGLRFRNRVGIGAGFDKDGVAIRGWAALGLGFVEIGTVTPRPQPGNPRPRLFRLPADRALINRMGFVNAGAGAAATRVASARRHLPEGFVVGASIGRNATTGDGHATDDFVAAAATVAGAVDYLVVNVSSPNTPGLRELQEPASLLALLTRVEEVAEGRPLLVKLAPELDAAVLAGLVDALGSSPVGGLVLGNTTTAREGLRSSQPLTAETGGLSGAPLLEPMLAAVERVRSRSPDRFVVVASGGIGSADDARRALDAGADLVQLWTGLVYAGPGLIGEVVSAT